MNAVLHQVEHLAATDPAVPGKDRGRVQRFGGIVDPCLVGIGAEDIIRLALRSFVLRVLLDHRHFLDELELALGVAQRLAQRRQIAVHRGFGDRRAVAVAPAPAVLQGPHLERLNLRLIDPIERQISPGAVFEEFAVDLAVELDGSFLLFLGSSDPGIEDLLVLPQRGDPAGWFRGGDRLWFLDAGFLANEFQARSRGNIHRLAPVRCPGGAGIDLPLIGEPIAVVRAVRTFPDVHAMSARRVLRSTSWRMVSGRIMTRVPIFT
ncbi:MAG TPA: hypothetical protein VHZ09_20415 [Acidobacteriaceae bacterium]|nr:hypothetical protein [Acidobacteriaceae bacterium]